MLDKKNAINTLKILKSLGANYPILKCWGFDFTKAIFIRVNEGQSKNIARILTNNKLTMAQEVDKVRDLENMLRRTNSEYVVYPFTNTRRSREHINYFSAAVKANLNEECGVRALPLIISEEEIPRDDADNFFIIYIDCDLDNVSISVDDVVPEADKIEVVRDKIAGINMAGKTFEEKMLLAASCFIYPCLVTEERQQEFSCLVRVASMIVARDEDNRDTSELADLFITRLYSWQEQEHFKNIYMLPELVEGVEERMGHGVFYDAKYVFMSGELLDEICSPLLNIFSINVLKSSLVDKGILYPESARTYTAKMGYFVNGEYRRTRMIRFKREMLKRIGDLDFITMCVRGWCKGED